MLKVLADKTRLVFFARGRMTAETGTQRINHDENERVSRRKKLRASDLSDVMSMSETLHRDNDIVITLNNAL